MQVSTGTPFSQAGARQQALIIAPCGSATRLGVQSVSRQVHAAALPRSRRGQSLEYISLHFSPRGEAKCVRGPSGRGARRLARTGVLGPYVEHGKQAQRSHGGRIACSGRRVVRNAGWPEQDQPHSTSPSSMHMRRCSVQVKACTVVFLTSPDGTATLP